jgi:hypothetical protein
MQRIGGRRNEGEALIGTSGTLVLGMNRECPDARDVGALLRVRFPSPLAEALTVKIRS